MAAALEAALGTACCWGLSPALDLHQHRELRLPARFPPPPPPPRSIFPGNTDFFFPGNPGFSPVPHAGNGDATALLVGAAEGRHLLLTASRAHREPRCAITVRLPDGGGAVTGTSRPLPPVTAWPPPQIFVAEERPEPVARQLLFLLLATAEPPGSAGLRGNGEHRDRGGGGWGPL